MSTVKTKRLQRKTDTNKEYLKYVSEYKQPDKQPMTRYHWERSGRTTAYGATGGTTALAKLSRKERKSVGVKD